jgi:membrane associated rhomboid family serine protease
MFFPFHDDNATSRFPLVTCAIIGLNLASLLYIGMLPPLDREILVVERAFVPARIAQLTNPNLIVEVPLQIAAKPRLPPGWPPNLVIVPAVQPVHRLMPVRSEVLATLISSLFLHSGWMHLIGNMWFLWLFGNNVEDRLGHVLFIVLYVVGGVVASLSHWAMIPPEAALQPVIGASGAVATILGAYAVTFPKARVRSILVLIVFPIVVELPALLVLLIWFGGQLLDAVTGSHLTGGVACWAHVGGFVAGMILMPIFSRIAPKNDDAPQWESAW